MTFTTEKRKKMPVCHFLRSSAPLTSPSGGDTAVRPGPAPLLPGGTSADPRPCTPPAPPARRDVASWPLGCLLTLWERKSNCRLLRSLPSPSPQQGDGAAPASSWGPKSPAAAIAPTCFIRVEHAERCRHMEGRTRELPLSAAGSYPLLSHSLLPFALSFSTLPPPPPAPC